MAIAITLRRHGVAGLDELAAGRVPTVVARAGVDRPRGVHVDVMTDPGLV